MKVYQLLSSADLGMPGALGFRQALLSVAVESFSEVLKMDSFSDMGKEISVAVQNCLSSERLLVFFHSVLSTSE